MDSDVIMMCVIYGVLLFVYVVICLLLEYKGKVVDGIIKESIFIPKENISKVKFDVDGRIIKLKMKGHPEVGAKERFITYRWICILEAIHKIRIKLGLYLFGIPGFILFIFCLDYVKNADIKKIVAIVLWIVMIWGAGFGNYFLSKKTKERVNQIKNSNEYEKKSATIIERQKKGNESIFIAQFTDNGEIINKEVWTSALKNNFKIGEQVELYYNKIDTDSAAYVTFGEKDNGKATLFAFVSVGLIFLGIISGLCMYFKN